MTEAEEFNQENAKLYDGFDDDLEFMYERDNFEAWLNKSESKRGQKRTRHTVFSTMETVDYVFEGCGGYLSVNNLKEYKRTLKDNDRQPATINRRLAAANTYTTFLAEKYHNPHIKQLKVKNENVQPKQYIDNVITRADYEFLCAEAKKAKNPNLFIGIKIMGTTGVRLAELLQVKVEHIKLGYIDVLGKGAKRRRVYFPKAARAELLEFLDGLSGGTGYVMRYWNNTKDHKAFLANTRDLGDFNNQRTFVRSFQRSLELIGKKLGLEPEVMHAHGFRHFFAKEFLKNRLDISLLADLLGHSSLDITRIYLKMTSREQADVVDEVVTW